MAYTKQTWTNDVSVLSAGRMNYMEDGIEAAHNLAAVPPGAISAYAGASAPAGWLLCDGASVLRATYSALFAAISTAYGSADGTHFNVPDLQGRVPVGKGSHVDVDTLADTDGSALASRRPKHSHTVGDAGHTHTERSGSGASVGGSKLNWGSSFDNTDSATTIATASATTGVTVGPQTTAPADGPAYLTVNYIIKT